MSLLDRIDEVGHCLDCGRHVARGECTCPRLVASSNGHAAVTGDSTVTAMVTPPSNRETASDVGKPPGGDSGDRSDTPRRVSWTAAELMAADFPPTRWAVPHLVAEGVSVLAGSPKVGKSWLGLNLAVAVAAGGKALGRVDVAAGPVLYLALEDTPRRLQDRLRKVLGKDGPPLDGLTFVTACEALPSGGGERIGRWLAERPGARLVVVDVFARLRGATPPNVAAYDADYAAVGRAKRLADSYGVAVLLIHHTRKAAATDVLDEVSGTQGLAGAADAVMVLKRSRGEADATLHITGRDVEEAEHALSFAPDIGTWQLLDGPAYTHTLTDTRKAIHDYLAGYPGQPGPKQIAEGTGLEYDLVKQTVRRMVDDGQLRSDGRGHYTIPVTAVTSVTSLGQQGISGVTGVSPHTSPVTDEERGPSQ